jgi:hypothetical protein
MKISKMANFSAGADTRQGRNENINYFESVI